jgi:hypothetical protein
MVARLKGGVQATAGGAHRSSPPVIPEILYGSTLGLTFDDEQHQPKGLVTESEAARITSDLISKSTQIRDPGGNTVFEQILRANDVWWGEHVSSYPDVVLQLNSRLGGAVGSVDPRLFIPVTSVRTGDHHPYGILGFTQEFGRNQPAASSVWDVPAITLHLLGADVPRYLDSEIPDWIPGDRRFTDSITDQRPESHQYSSDDANAIEQRLRSLGYLE